MGLNLLPEDCVGKILSFTTPADVIRLSLVSKLFLSSSRSDAVWERFLPAEHRDGRVSQPQRYSSTKDLFLAFCDHPVVIDGGKKTFSLEKRTGKKCYMLSARDLVVIWSNNPSYWRWIPFPESRFPEVAELITVCWLEIRGNINPTILSRDTVYAAYLVFRLTDSAHGWEYPGEIMFNIVGNESTKRLACLNEEGTPWPSWVPDRRNECEYPKEREDGWLQIKLGEFYNMGDDRNDEELEMSLKEIRHLNWKSGLLVLGIEIKPKPGLDLEFQCVV